MADSIEPPASGPEGFVQCEVTGQWLPEDETIEFQGKRVGAQGKQVLLERLRSGEGTGEMEKPTALRRWGCWMIDGLILGGGLLLISFISGITMGANEAVQPQGNETVSLSSQALPHIMTLIYGVAVLAYYTFFHGIKGQTPGKMMGHLWVVLPDGSPIGLKKAFWRALFYYGPSLLLAILLLIFILIPEMRAGRLLAPILSIIGSLYVIIDLIFALADTRQQRALHDRLAATRVIHIEKE